jgi:hypothetical protein
MTRVESHSGRAEAYSFRVLQNGSYVTVGAYSVDFAGASDSSVMSYHLSAASAGASVISMPYASALPASSKVARGRFRGTDASGNFFESEVLHITIR